MAAILSVYAVLAQSSNTIDGTWHAGSLHPRRGCGRFPRTSCDHFRTGFVVGKRCNKTTCRTLRKSPRFSMKKLGTPSQNRGEMDHGGGLKS